MSQSMSHTEYLMPTDSVTVLYLLL